MEKYKPENGADFPLGDEVIGEEGDCTIIRRRAIRTPIYETKPHYVMADYRVRKSGNYITEELIYGTEKDFGPVEP